jgi:hypothetical protein
MSVRHTQSSYSVDMASQGDHEFTFGKVPELNGSIIRTRDKELVLGVNGKASNLTSMTTNNSLQLPGGVPLRLDYLASPQHNLVLILSQSFDKTITTFVLNIRAQVFRYFRSLLLLLYISQCLLCS